MSEASFGKEKRAKETGRGMVNFGASRTRLRATYQNYPARPVEERRAPGRAQDDLPLPSPKDNLPYTMQRPSPYCLGDRAEALTPFLIRPR